MKKIIFSAIILILIFAANAINQELENLKQELSNDKLSTNEKIDILLEIGQYRRDLPLEEMRSYADQAYQLCDSKRLLPKKALVYYWKSEFTATAKDREGAEEFLNEGLKIARDLDSPKLKGLYHYNRAFLLLKFREFRQAEIELLSALDYSDYFEDEKLLRIYNNLSNIYYYHSDYASAMSYSLKQLDLAEKDNNHKELAYANTSLGNIYNDLNDLETARDYYLESIEHFEEIDADMYVYSVQNNLGTVYSKMEDYESADKLYHEVLKKAEQYDDKETIFYAYLNIGMIEVQKHSDYKRAMELFKTAEEYKDFVTIDNEITLLHLNLGTAYFHLEKYEDAKKDLETALRLAEETNDYKSMEDILEIMLYMSYKCKDMFSSEELLGKYLEVVNESLNQTAVEVSEVHRRYNQEKFDHQIKILKQREEINLLEMHKQQRVTFFIIVFLLFIVLAFFYVIHTNGKLKKLKDSLEIKVEESLEKIRNQESLMIMQNHQASMGEMLSMIAHQWKQPLNAIGLIAQNLDDAYEYDEFSEELLNDSVKNIMEQIHLMSNTLNSFRDYYRFGDDKPFLLDKAIESSISYCGPLLRKNKIKLSFEGEGNIQIFGQENLLVQVMLVLISNSRDAFEENGIEDKKIEINSNIKEDTVELSVTDNAGGIPPQYLDKIFKAYFTTKESDKGTGIGLYIAQAVIQQKFNGKIKAFNVDSGCRILIDLPVSKEID